jgi:LuxR family maltose regulon positive regulatory protein
MPLRDEDAAASALERALDVAEPDGVLGILLLYPVPALLERQARQGTAHPALIADILSLLAGRQLAPQPVGPEPLLEALTDLGGFRGSGPRCGSGFGEPDPQCDQRS